MPNLIRENFNEVVAEATIEASLSRKELGWRYAAEFKTAPETFDPCRLLRLGPTGLQTFAAAMDVATLSVRSLSTQVEEKTACEPATDWKIQEGPIVPFEAVGIIMGILTGVVAITGISLLSWLFG